MIAVQTGCPNTLMFILRVSHRLGRDQSRQHSHNAMGATIKRWTEGSSKLFPPPQGAVATHITRVPWSLLGCMLFTIMLRYYCTNLTTAVLCLLQGAYVFAVPPLLVCWYRPYPQGRGRIHIPYLDFDMLFDFRELLLDLLALASHVGSATMRSASVPTSAQMPSESESESLQQLAMVVTLSV